MKFQAEHAASRRSPTLKSGSSKLGDREIDKKSWRQEALSLTATVSFTLIFVSLVTVFLFRISPVDGSSMLPTLHNGDQLITTNLHGKLDRGDVVVIRRNDDTALVKRIIGIEGDRIDIDFEKAEVYLNDELLDEPYINEPTENPLDFTEPVVVPKGHVFVMGDNRNHSDDSRNSQIGMIDTRNIFGKAVLRVFPLNNFGVIK